MKLRQLKVIHHICYAYCKSCSTRANLNDMFADLDDKINTYYCEPCVTEIDASEEEC